MSTTIEVKVTTRTPHSGTEVQQVIVQGHESIDLYLQAIRAAMVAASYAPETAARIVDAEAPDMFDGRDADGRPLAGGSDG